MKGSPIKGSHFLQLKVEGFALDKLLTQCLKSRISLANIRFNGELEMTLLIRGRDYDAFRRIVKSQYRISVIQEDGLRHRATRIWSKKSTVIGIALFFLILYVQSLFIAEIRIEGYSRIQESVIRNTLAEVGFAEGRRKSSELSDVMAHLYQALDNISWVGITYEGSLARVVIAEGTLPEVKVDRESPCNVVSDKSGYVERIIAREGKPAVKQGTYVKPGDVLIHGVLPIESKVYGQENLPLFRYVHASGQVTARILYRSVYYQDAYELIKEPTGKWFPGIRINAGEWEWDSSSWTTLMTGFDSSVAREWKLIHLTRPLPLRIALVQVKEVKLFRKKRTQQEIRQDVNELLMEELRNKLPRNAQISNKSLKFSPGKNIIEIVVLAEVLEQIGREAEVSIGESTD